MTSTANSRMAAKPANKRYARYVARANASALLRIGTRVEAGIGAGHDVGTVILATDYEAAHRMNDGTAVYVAWDSGVRTWTPMADLSEM